MRKVLIVLSGALLLGQSQIFAQSQSRPDKCGVPALHRKMIANDPAWEQKLQDRKASLQAAADYYKQYKAQQDARSERTTTTVSAVPIIFHIIVDSVQFNALGGTAGIIKRCDSQIAVLNHDFNKQNADSTLIPSGWKPLYGKPGISFGLAHKDRAGIVLRVMKLKLLPEHHLPMPDSTFFPKQILLKKRLLQGWLHGTSPSITMSGASTILASQQIYLALHSL